LQIENVSIWDNPDNFVNKDRGFQITLNLGKSVNSTVLKLGSLNPNNYDHNPSNYEILQFVLIVTNIWQIINNIWPTHNGMLPPFRKATLSPPKEGFSVSSRTALIELPDGVRRRQALSERYSC
jgi:hypothetical protein